MDANKKTSVIELNPGTLEKNGIAYAPRTLASLVYMDDGTTLSNTLDELIADGKRFILKTKTELLTVQFDGQRIYEIPTPLEKYNFNKFPIVVSINDRMIAPADYRLNANQLILSERINSSVRQGDILTFIFHYLDIIIEDCGINAEFINNVRFFVDRKEPRHKRRTDVWFDTLFNQVKQFDGEDWNIIVSGSGGNGGSNLVILKSNATITNHTSTVDIGISEYNNREDTLFVYLNSTYLEEGQDYTIDRNNRLIHSVRDNWDGTEDPQVFNFIVFKNVSQSSSSSMIMKSTNSTVRETSTIEIGINNYDSKKDTLFVYLNSTYLEEGQDYNVIDSRIIRKVSGRWNGTEEVQTFNFIVFKNVLQSFVDRARSGNISEEINEVELENIPKEINMDENSCILQLINIIKDCRSTISLLEEKVDKLQKIIQQ